MTKIANRYEFVLLFDVVGSNPNGDPDMDNMPRQMEDSGLGYMTDVSLKRKIRDTVELLKDNEEGYRIYIRKGSVLAQTNEKLIDSLPKEQQNDPEARKKAMTAAYYDTRIFGAVTAVTIDSDDETENGNASTEGEKKKRKKKKEKEKIDLGCGQIQGPVQISSLITSIDPIEPVRIALTRCARSKQKDDDDASVITDESGEQKSKHGQFGAKWVVPYGLYRVNGFINPFAAAKTGATEEDLELLWEAMEHMFTFDKAAGRSDIRFRALVVFKHVAETERGSMLGVCAPEKTLKLVQVDRMAEKPLRPEDYRVKVLTPPARVEIAKEVLA